jgi:transposase-like protein
MSDTETTKTLSLAQHNAARMPRTNGRFAGHSAEQRRAILAEVEARLNRGKTLYRIARDLDLGRNTLARWIADAEPQPVSEPTETKGQDLTRGPLHSRARARVTVDVRG